MKKILLLIVLALSSCNQKPSKETHTITKVSLRQEWFANASYLGEVVAINETDSLNGLQIDLIAGADDVDPLKMVLSGNNDFGVCGADRIYTAQEKGADLVIIGVINYLNPTCFIAKSEEKVYTPKDFEGKKVGVYTGNNTEMVYRTLIKKAGVDVTKIREVEPSFDLSTFIAGAYDIRPAYIFDETVSLDQKGIKYTIIKPQDYGVNFIGNVYFTTKKMILEKPDVVQSFINSVAEGWKLASKNPQKAVKYLKQYDKNIDANRELLSFNKGKSYFIGENGKILYVKHERWNEMGNYLKDLKIIKSFDVSKIVDSSFVNNINK